MKNSIYPKIFILILAILPILCPPSNGLIKTSPEFLKASIGLPLIFLFLFLSFFLKDKPSFQLFFKEKTSMALALFLGWCLVTILWATNPFEGFRCLLPWAGAGITYFLIARNFEPKNDLKIFMKAMFISGFVAATIGVFQYLLGYNFFSQAMVPASTFGNKNMGAEYTILTLPLGFYFFFNEKKKSDAIFYLFMISNMLLYVIYVKSRSSYLSLLAQIFFFGVFCFVKYLKDKKVPFFTPTKIKMLLGLSLYLFFAMNMTPQGFRWQLGTYLNRFDSVVKEAKVDNAKTVANAINANVDPYAAGKGNTRISFWVNSLLMLKDYPFGGVGVGNWSIEYPKYHDKIMVDREYDDKIKLYQMHNEFLEIFVTTGLIGGILFLSFIFFFFRDCYQLYGSEEFKEKNEVLFLALGFSGFLVFGNFNYPLQVYVTMMVICSYAGMVMALKFSYKKATSNLENEMKIPLESNLKLKRITSLALFLLITHLMYRFLMGEHYYHIAKYGEIPVKGQTAKLGRFLVENAKISMDLDPFNWRAALLLAKGYWYLNDGENAYEVLKDTLKYNPMNQTVLNNIGIYALKAGHLEKTIEYWSKVIENHSDKKYVERMQWTINRLKKQVEAQKQAKAFLPN
jgi:putative inorganic carbon (hco3(-)) transporter